MTADDATLRQIRAADPSASTWLAANAGSGKTRVLTDRVARLLLRRVSPQNILCLTYTKAAATEMQNRLFERLGSWAMKSDDTLRRDLTMLGANEALEADDLSHARTLFARAIETPGGLKIQTIHSFCASLLRRFPMESGVSPFFTEIDERSAKRLREEVVEDMASGSHLPLIQALARQYSGEDFAGLTSEIVGRREALANPANRSAIWSAFGLKCDYDDTSLAAELFVGDEPHILRQLIQALESSDKVTDIKEGKRLGRLNLDRLSTTDLSDLAAIFLTGARTKEPFTAKVGTFPTKGLQAKLHELMPSLHAFMLRVEAARIRQISLKAAEKTLVLHDFARAFLPEFERRKQSRGWLDFDDLIFGARNLLTDPAVAQWVLYRLDGGIDHVLVDEAQDTSPNQWRVIELLAQEFASGQGARSDIERTIFVVGDLKQSIYSFQGADPGAFDRMRSHFDTQLNGAGRRLKRESLDHSFRSSSAILRVVDATFQATGGAGLDGPPLHLAFHESLPGRVDLWPVVPKSEAAEDREWYDPTDMIAANDARVILARHIASEIARLLDIGSIPAGNGAFRRITPGDFLILVQRRSKLFHEIIRACKSQGLEIAGADRLKVGAELAVRDLTAMLRFLATPDDDLSLAAALRSPLLGLSEAELFDLAHTRHEIQLWPALRRRKNEFLEAHEILSELRDQTDFLGPYDLLERILTRHRGRVRLLARLGEEAEDGIDAMLSLAMTYEAAETPSLTGFLSWMEAEEVEIKRQSDAAGDRIRVMTTHGAKGLESPIVFLPDTADRSLNHRNEIILSDHAPPVWKCASDQQPDMMKEALSKAKEAQDEERMRLLYVALTRAETWLIVCGCGQTGADPGNWHGLVEAGMTSAGALETDMPTGTGLRLQVGQWREASPSTAKVSSSETPVPAWTKAKAVMPLIDQPVLSPSLLGGAKVMAGEVETLDSEAAMTRGSQIHLLLEHLPGTDSRDWNKLANSLLAMGGYSIHPDEATQILDEARKVLENPALRGIFADDALAEVGISATLPQLGGQRISGSIDRLVVRPDSVLAVDFKSNAIVPDTPGDVPDGLLRQLGAYAAALEQIYPEKRVDTAILWTRTASLMHLPHDIVSAALCNTATS